ncbi:hypothetical protein C2S53_008504 [Perilla frutescens var. hirtella]|uniref:Transposase MuDR plant domain-containing protein n=1 Tax=Perilla frutescens var. hirtella TaxID=608512 RepID=A0AAD4JQ47_PERFH|nr:hypothetical protein C2S53_008504 [Perilla frutescens var. hirtella]
MVSLPITDDFEESESSIDSDFNEEIRADEEITDDMCFEDYVDKEVELIGNDEEKSDTTETQTDGKSKAGFESLPSDCDHEHTNMFDEVDAYNPSYELNQVFSYKTIFREIVHSHAIQTRRNIKIVKNDGRRVYAKCLGLNCEWRINLLKIEKEESWQVREYHFKHKCCESMNNSNVKSNWIAKRFEEEFRSDAKRNTQGFRLDVINLWDYADMLRTTNPGSTVIMALDEASGSNNSPKRFSAEHRFCVRHLHGNMKVAGFRGNPFKNVLWTPARASTILEFSKTKEEKLDPRYWSGYMISHHPSGQGHNSRKI